MFDTAPAAATPVTSTTPETPTRSNGYYNRAALKRHALKVSNTVRSGKFTRVSEKFLNDVEASADAFIRKLRADIPGALLGTVPPDEFEEFMTGAGKKKLAEAFNLWLAHEVQRKQHDIRTGTTL